MAFVSFVFKDLFVFQSIRIHVMKIPKWLPALSMMLVIFWFSAHPASSLPDFDWADKLVKKGGHVIGYALLAWSYWYAFGFHKDKRWLAWLFVILYAMTDEFHQSFVAGRHPSVWDVIIFNNFGALISLWIIHMKTSQRLS